MNRVKTDLRNRLSRNHLDICVTIGKEGVAVDTFNPDPVIELWFFDRVHYLKSGLHMSSKCVKTGASSEGNYIDLYELIISNLENNSGDKFQDYYKRMV